MSSTIHTNEDTARIRRRIHGDHSGWVYLVGAGPGDPELITLKAARLLQMADVIFYDRLVNPQLLDHARPGARKIGVGKSPGGQCIRQQEINSELVSEALHGHTVVRLKGGDPFIFGRGGEECLELARAGIPFEIVPGISSMSSVPAYAGIPLTMRNEASAFTVISGHLHAGSKTYDWASLASVATLVILMGLKKLPEIIEKLIRHGKSPDTPIALIRSGTTKDQKVITGTLSDIGEKSIGLDTPVTVVIGEVVRYHESLKWFRPEFLSEVSKESKSSILSITTAASL